MPSVQIKEVPPDVHRVIRSRAALAGKSMQEYLLDLLTSHARSPTMTDILRRVEQRTGGGITPEFAVEAQRAERESH